ncbi:hypothetical protein Btru_051175 [Bulinus truncatus]|nr:hypothetical protein Btru_051175 [Bulinus truncatus]
MDRRLYFFCLVFASSGLSSVGCQLSQLTLQFRHTNDPRAQSTSELWLDDVNINLIQNKVCHAGSDVTFVLRTNPSQGTMQVVSKSIALDVTDQDVHSCKPTYAPVVCDADICKDVGSCSVKAMVACEVDNDVTDWESTVFIDFVLYQDNGHLAMLDCLEKCTYSGDTKTAPGSGQGGGGGGGAGSNGLSYLAIGLIVAGAILLGAVLTIAVVVWKIRDSKSAARKYCSRVTCAK